MHIIPCAMHHSLCTRHFLLAQPSRTHRQHGRPHTYIRSLEDSDKQPHTPSFRTKDHRACLACGHYTLHNMHPAQAHWGPAWPCCSTAQLGCRRAGRCVGQVSGAAGRLVGGAVVAARLLRADLDGLAVLIVRRLPEGRGGGGGVRDLVHGGRAGRGGGTEIWCMGPSGAWGLTRGLPG
jgi:hypothetical protein